MGLVYFTGMNLPVIDGHVHVFSPSVCKNRNNFFYDKNFILLYDNPRSKIIDAPQLLAKMSESGVGTSLCMGFAWMQDDDCSRENEYILRVAKENKGRIIPFASVPLECNNPEEYVKNLSSMGFAGIGEIAFYTQGFGAKEEKYLIEIFQACCDANICAVIHLNEPVGHTYAGKYHTDFSRLISIITEFPTLRLMLSHWGGGLFVYELMPEISKALASVWYDTAASPFLYSNKIYSTVCSIAGSKRIILGSDYPLMSIKKYIDGINEEFNNNEIIENICRNNAVRFLGDKNTALYF
jgi:uncharacterized protein